MSCEEPMERLEFEAAALMARHPPLWHHRNKKLVYDMACPQGCTHAGTLEYSRWGAMPLPSCHDPAAASHRLVARGGYYAYLPLPEVPGAMEWHVNFADPHLFVAYGSALFAQDEMQVSEHPALGALKEALSNQRLPALTEENGRPTPVLVAGVERRCAVATDPNPSEGRPEGLYGNNFARGAADAIRRATTRMEPPTITNLIAMAAPGYGEGPYSLADIQQVMVTAFTGFRAAVLESTRLRSGPCPVVVHTGFWGCGAFGGNRVLMAALQVLAAGMAGVERLVFHTGDGTGAGALEEARRLIEKELASTPGETPAACIERIASMGFEWGVSDGN